jgi:uncharacterized protein (DUF433 family)
VTNPAHSRANDAAAAERPAYSVAEAAKYLRMQPATLRTWILGRPYPTQDGQRVWEPLIHAAEGRPTNLTFNNLVEAHVLSAIRRVHDIPFPKIRAAIDYVRDRLNVDRPLLEQEFETDGVDLFVQELGKLVAASRGGQIALSDILRQYLKRIDRQPAGLLRLFPFTRLAGDDPVLDSPRVIVIDPRVSFGRPVITGTGVRAEVIVARFVAGESIEELAADLELEQRMIQEAVRWEQLAA